MYFSASCRISSRRHVQSETLVTRVPSSRVNVSGSLASAVRVAGSETAQPAPPSSTPDDAGAAAAAGAAFAVLATASAPAPMIAVTASATTADRILRLPELILTRPSSRISAHRESSGLRKVSIWGSKCFGLIACGRGESAGQRRISVSPRPRQRLSQFSRARESVQDLLAVLRELVLADAADGAQLGERGGRLGRDLTERRVVEDHVRRDALLLRRRGPPRAQPLEDRHGLLRQLL